MLSIERLRPRHGATVLFLLTALIGMLWSKTPTLDPPVAIAAPLPYESVTTAPDERPPEIRFASTESSSPLMPVSAPADFVHSHDPRPSAVDFPAQCGEPIRAILGGTVTEAYWADDNSWGATALVNHGNGTQARYAHASSISVTAGQSVSQGDVIGYVGTTGQSTGCHLHVEAYGITARGLLGGADPAPTPPPIEAVEAPAPTSSSGRDWNRLMMCESGAHGQWRANTGNGYHGGLQFDPDTWNLFGGQEYAATADQATDVEQIAIGEKVLAAQGPGAWPECSYVKEPGWWQGGGSSAPVASIPAPAPSAPVATTPVQVEPQALPAAPTQAPTPAPTQSWVDLALDPPAATETPAPVHEAPAAPAAPVWVEEVVEQLPEPIQAPVQDWVEQQIPAYEPPAPVYQAPALVAPAIPAPVLDHVQSFVQNTPALSGNPAITGALASLGVG